MSSSYIETFDDGPGGWHLWLDNFRGAARPEMKDGALVSRAPWWIDYNHAPPGGGYMNLPFCLRTAGPCGEMLQVAGGRNRFVAGGFSTNLTNARLSVRIKGELEKRGSELCLLAQARHDNIAANWTMSRQPIAVTRQWSRQTVTITPDESQWTFMGSRHDRTDTYGHVDLKTVLSDVNIDILLVLFPVNVVPMGPPEGDMHKLRPELDYPVWRSKLPDGYIMLDEVKIEYP